MSHRIRCAFGREPGSDWYLWHALSEADWEAGTDLPELPAPFESREIWVNVDDEEVQKTLNAPDLKGKIDRFAQL